MVFIISIANSCRVEKSRGGNQDADGPDDHEEDGGGLDGQVWSPRSGYSHVSGIRNWRKSFAFFTLQ